MFEARHAISAYWQVRRIRTTRDLRLRQRTRLKKWLQDDVPNVPRYRGFRGDLADLPVINKATLMSDFAAFNAIGLDDKAAWAAFDGDKMVGDFIVGASTGTSGNRGLFVISQAERYRWLGTILGKALPGFWWQRHRVAVMLPINTPLYDSANRTRLLSVRFFDVATDWSTDLIDFQPSVIIAPPKILRAIAESDMALAPQHIFSGAEQLDPLDRDIIEDRFDLILGQIYMATEGLMAVTCACGTLHLAEDVMHFELPQVGDDPFLREVIISDFSRRTQIMARYRMNDLVRLSDTPCSCGSPLRAVSEVVGRMDDCFRLGPDRVMITPDLIRNAVVDSDRMITDFRVVQLAEDAVSVQTNGSTPDAGAALKQLFTTKGLNVSVTLLNTPITLPRDRKLRRVENAFTP